MLKVWYNSLFIIRNDVKNHDVIKFRCVQKLINAITRTRRSGFGQTTWKEPIHLQQHQLHTHEIMTIYSYNLYCDNRQNNPLFINNNQCVLMPKTEHCRPCQRRKRNVRHTMDKMAQRSLFHSNTQWFSDFTSGYQLPPCQRWFSTQEPTPPINTDVANSELPVLENEIDHSSTAGNNENRNEIFKKLIYDDILHNEALQFVTKQQNDDEWKRNALIQLFDAIIFHHRSLVDQYNSSFPTMMTLSSFTTTVASTINSTTTTLTSDQVNLLQQIIQYAEMANNIIEILEPFLGARNAWLDLPTANYNNDDDMISSSTLVEDEEDPVDDHLVATGDNHDSISLDETIPFDDTTSSTTQSSPKKRRRNIVDIEMTDRCNEVLQAWTQTVRAGFKGNVSRSLVRAIPQRAQFLLSRMEITVEDENYEGHLMPPSLISYNSVLETWAYSREHLRGASAQQIFDKLLSKKIGTAYYNIRPDGNSFRTIIWAWALSRERRAAYIATGHLIKMLRRLEVGFDDNGLYDGVPIEPNIEDYNIVAQAWIRSEYANIFFLRVFLRNILFMTKTYNFPLYLLYHQTGKKIHQVKHNQW
jgi:hypothetical protein